MITFQRCRLPLISQTWPFCWDTSHENVGSPFYFTEVRVRSYGSYGSYGSYANGKIQNANGLFNVHRCQRLVTHTLDDTAFGVKVDFCGGRKTGEPEEKPSYSDWDQPITSRKRATDRTQAAVLGGANDDHSANLIPNSYPRWIFVQLC